MPFTLPPYSHLSSRLLLPLYTHNSPSGSPLIFTMLPRLTNPYQQYSSYLLFICPYHFNPLSLTFSYPLINLYFVFSPKTYFSPFIISLSALTTYSHLTSPLITDISILPMCITSSSPTTFARFLYLVDPLSVISPLPPNPTLSRINVTVTATFPQCKSPGKLLFTISNILVIAMLPGRAACAVVYEDVVSICAILCTAPYFLFFCRYPAQVRRVCACVVTLKVCVCACVCVCVRVRVRIANRERIRAFIPRVHFRVEPELTCLIINNLHCKYAIVNDIEIIYINIIKIKCNIFDIYI